MDEEAVIARGKDGLDDLLYYTQPKIETAHKDYRSICLS